jgi:histone-lysine N-methyltransferase SETMAR
MGVGYKYGQEVPHELTDDNKADRLSISSAHLSRQKRSKLFLDKMITGDESWLFTVNMKRKKQHLKPGEHGKVYVKPDPHRKKFMLCVFWDKKGVIYWEWLGGKEKLNADRYCKQLRALAEVLPEKRPEKTKVLFHRDNARPHVAAATRKTIEELGWEVMAHPAWSPDLAPSDYALFRSLKNELAEKHFENENDLENWLRSFFDLKSRQFYVDAINDLPRRWALVVDHDGDYFDDV